MINPRDILSDNKQKAF